MRKIKGKDERGKELYICGGYRYLMFVGMYFSLGTFIYVRVSICMWIHLAGAER